ncbi:MCM DNA helicase complex subunit mcm6 [Bonamia ostreae]|uniref:MCM DNA helicase complex subunit mcm6 n=1 Tax=Bonamia ostreae TaxID=126728 RepID=A0ABV2AF27_9EUKA
MSRFDLFFVVTDTCDDDSDYGMARHILARHRGAPAALSAPYGPAALANYIRYARSIRPAFPSAAMKLVVQSYCALRQSDSGGAKAAYRITVRQLESLIRLSEALARAELKDKVANAIEGAGEACPRGGEAAAQVDHPGAFRRRGAGRGRRRHLHERFCFHAKWQGARCPSSSSRRSRICWSTTSGERRNWPQSGEGSPSRSWWSGTWSTKRTRAIWAGRTRSRRRWRPPEPLSTG